MSRKNTEELLRVHIWVFAQDVERMDKMLPDRRSRSLILRSIIHKYLNAVEAQVSAKIDGQDSRPIMIEIGAEGA